MTIPIADREFENSRRPSLRGCRVGERKAGRAQRTAAETATVELTFNDGFRLP